MGRLNNYKMWVNLDVIIIQDFYLIVKYEQTTRKLWGRDRYTDTNAYTQISIP